MREQSKPSHGFKSCMQVGRLIEICFLYEALLRQNDRREHWRPSEYLCHTRIATDVQRGRLIRMKYIRIPD
ncbi:hypothetical protein XELAEV_18031607mg [Xenopus laevis]|uniref:Uncharacterized protein n=1 Tax=Xenopus laevis TaxID=8355 RepID=A0A974CP40_XENLA|nr:hypothetical protein XELAEV_18031607mg [Xenopus laevis]